jgi:DNA-directed RNA polymerase specialized sigma subunit
MSDGKWLVNSTEEARESLLEMLHTYRLERRNLEQERRMIREAMTTLVDPHTSDPSRPRVQVQPNDDAMIQRVERMMAERRAFEQELQRIAERENRLNRMVRTMGELSAFERHVVIGQYIDGRRVEELKAMIGRSTMTIDRCRRSALRKMVRSLYRVRDNSIRAEVE